MSDILQAIYRGDREEAERLSAGKELNVFEASALGRTERLAELLDSDPALGAEGSLVTCDETAPGLKRLEAWLNSTISKEQCRNARFI